MIEITIPFLLNICVFIGSLVGVYINLNNKIIRLETKEEIRSSEDKLFRTEFHAYKTAQEQTNKDLLEVLKNLEIQIAKINK